LDLRQRHPRWGARKIRSLLKTEGKAQPGSSTITALFHRHGLIEPSPQAKPNWQRFEREYPTVFGRWISKAPCPPRLAFPCTDGVG